eukprot:jgi/Tetstr1/441497/TSEL_029728.t1
MKGLPVPPVGTTWKSFRGSAAPSAGSAKYRVVYTHTDEAPMLATYSLLPIIQRFAGPLGIQIETRDISVAGRILAAFSDKLPEEQVQPDDLAELGALAKTPEANIIKLPNVSASVPQLQAAIAELQSKGYALPAYTPDPKTPSEAEAKQRYSKVLGSAVNPVLREGNSDRRSADPVKAYAQKHPHKMLPWPTDSKCCVASMSDGDFYGSERSHVMAAAGSVSATLVGADGSRSVLREGIKLQAGEVVDATRMSAAALRAFFEAELADSASKGLMTSLHMKATMMKVSDPIVFGHCVKVYFKEVWDKYGALLEELHVNPNNGLGDVYEKLAGHPQQAEVEAALAAVYSSPSRPGLAMVNSAKGITNLHVPSDVIIDASMPCVVRDGGKMWNKDDVLEDVKCMIPDRCYAGIYAAVLDDCKQHGQFDVATMGYVANVGLMAQKAEEYGSHDKTFEIAAPGKVEVRIDGSGELLFEHTVEAGDIWRMCQTKDAAIRDWLIALCTKYLAEHDTAGLDIAFADPVAAMKESCTRARAGLNTISVTGNVLRDYLTDLFPIIELGTSAKMLSIVPLLAGGCLLETGAGGSAPKHVQQFVEEGHLRWDSLGEYLATAISFEELAARTDNASAATLGAGLMDCRGRRAEQPQVAEPQPELFAKLAAALTAGEEQIVGELLACQGKPVDIGGYYKPDPTLTAAAMRPSTLFNQLMDDMQA